MKPTIAQNAVLWSPLNTESYRVFVEALRMEEMPRLPKERPIKRKTESLERERWSLCQLMRREERKVGWTVCGWVDSVRGWGQLESVPDFVAV